MKKWNKPTVSIMSCATLNEYISAHAGTCLLRYIR